MEDEAGCSDTVTGELERCGPGDKGCFISRGVVGGNNDLFSTSDRRFPATYGSDVAFERGCTEVSDENLYKCQTVEDSHGGKGLLCYKYFEKDDSTQTNERKRVALLQLPRKRVQ